MGWASVTLSSWIVSRDETCQANDLKALLPRLNGPPACSSQVQKKLGEYLEHEVELRSLAEEAILIQVRPTPLPRPTTPHHTPCCSYAGLCSPPLPICIPSGENSRCQLHPGPAPGCRKVHDVAVMLAKRMGFG
jgi:hypothetical protein